MITNTLSANQLQTFAQDGMLVCPDFFSASQLQQLQEWTAEVASWAEQEESPGHHYFEKTPQGPALARSEGFAAEHAGFGGLFSAGKLPDSLSLLFGEAATLFKEKINYKHPGGAGFAPHQDATAYQFGSLHITCLVAIDDCTLENGCLSFACGRHRDGLLPADDDGCVRHSLAEEFEWTAAPAPAGGVVFFDSFVPHRSAPNTTAQSRRAIYATFIKLAEGDLRDAYYADRQQRLAEHKARHPGSSRISTIGHFQGEIVE